MHQCCRVPPAAELAEALAAFATEPEDVCFSSSMLLKGPPFGLCRWHLTIELCDRADLTCGMLLHWCLCRVLLVKSRTKEHLGAPTDCISYI